MIKKSTFVPTFKIYTKMTYSNENLELFLLRYQAGGVPAKMTLQQFCSKNKVRNLVNK